MTQVYVGADFLDLSMFADGDKWKTGIEVPKNPARTSPVTLFVDPESGKCINSDMFASEGFAPYDVIMIDNTTYQAQHRNGSLYLVLVNNGALPRTDQFTKR